MTSSLGVSLLKTVGANLAKFGTAAKEFLEKGSGLRGRIFVRVHLDGPGPLDPVLELGGVGKIDGGGFSVEDVTGGASVKEFNAPKGACPCCGGYAPVVE